MTFEKPSPVGAWTQELRLATTMTGGVSLAIWMAGVAREINLLAQASEWRRADVDFPTDSPLNETAEASLRLYAQLIDLLDIVVDVDILSGTSAGGINAALLGWSRVRGSDLGRLRNLWLDLGSLTDLLRDPRDKNTPSLLYGDERMFTDLVKEIPLLETGPFPPAAFPARPPSTTVYITTTLLTGEISRFTDSFGTLVQDDDRRGLFTFTETQLTDPHTAPALALAARSSASFPAAFEPSFLPFTEGTPAQERVPARPAMKPFTNITRPHWVADGGLLDNQPIDVLLKRVFDRPAHRSVRRVLLFVVPSSGPAPELTKEAPADNVADPLGLADGLLRDLAAMTTQSIAADLRAIRAHQDRMDARTETRLRLAELASTLPQGTRLLTPNLLMDYRKREATKQTQMLTKALLRQLSTWPPESSSSTQSIPKKWEPELAIGGGAENACRQAIMESILIRWPQPPNQPLPERPAELAHYDQPAFEIAKGCALAVVQAAYQLAKPGDVIPALGELTDAIHQAWEPPAPSDLGELVRDVCTIPAVQQQSLHSAATILTRDYFRERTVSEEAWNKLGAAFVNGSQMLRDFAAAPASRPKDKDAASHLQTYLKYLEPLDNSQTVARKLFDLATTQRALLPADADVEQSLDLVQVSADTRSLLAPSKQTAQDKLTGMQLHHFGAFYKRSWRANDWMWGRLDGAGWLVHVLLDPRRVRWTVQAHAQQGEEGAKGRNKAQWFIDKLKAIGAPEFPSEGFRMSAADQPVQSLTENKLREELKFLDDPNADIPPSIPLTSLWLARAWQQRVLDEELEWLAKTVLDPQLGKKPDWSPTSSRSWAEGVLSASPGDNKYKLLDSDPVASETFATDRGSPLMARTITKAAATASAAAGSVRQLPGVIKPPLMTVRTLALGGYRVVSLTKGIATWSIIAGAALLVLGVAFAIQPTTAFGVVTGLALTGIGIGSYLIVLGTWQWSSRLPFALLSLTLVLAVFSLTTHPVRERLFGDEKRPGLAGANAYWLGTQWWHPLAVIGAIAVALTLIAAARPGRWIDERIRAFISAAKRCLARWPIRRRRGQTPDPASRQ
jgi:patatin-related protein